MPRWTEPELRAAVAQADSLSEVLRHFGLRAAGSNFKQLWRYLDGWGISTAHFTHGAKGRDRRPQRRPLEDYLVVDSTIHREKLKARLYGEGVKTRRCELCGQSEQWQGARMSLILDHVNGVHDDNRLANLRIVCPNCNATLPTHCGKNKPRANPPRPCATCGATFAPSRSAQRFCSRACWMRSRRGSTRPTLRKVERPPFAQLMEEIETSSWSAVGRKYGVSCNAVRKWVQAYQWQAAEAAGEGERRDAA